MTSGFVYNSAEATNIAEQFPPNDENCVNNTNMTSNYLTMECRNTLTNTTNTVSDLKCDTDAGWFNACVWLEQIVNQNGTTPTLLLVSSSQDGGQSYSNASEIITQVNMSNLGMRNPNIGINQEHVYVSYEKDMGSGLYDVFLARSDDGGLNFETPVNLSESPVDSIESFLLVDETGKYFVTWLELFPDGTIIESDCGKC